VYGLEFILVDADVCAIVVAVQKEEKKKKN